MFSLGFQIWGETDVSSAGKTAGMNVSDNWRCTVSYRLCHWLVLMLLLSAISAFGQNEGRPEFFVGYSNLLAKGVPDSSNDPSSFFNGDFVNNRGGLHGITGEVSLYPSTTSPFGLTGNISFNRMGKSAEIATGSNKEKTNVWYFMAGPSYVFPDQGRLVPFVRIMAGIARTNYEAAIERDVANATLKSTFDFGGTDFAMGFGAGLDLKVNDRFKVRIIQADYAPIFMGDRSVAVLVPGNVFVPRVFEGQRQDNIRFSFGVTF